MTGFNPELSNLPFDNKKQIYVNSHVEITKQVAVYVEWTEADIQRRGLALAERALQIWPFFGCEEDEEAEEHGSEFQSGDPAMSQEQILEVLGGGTKVSGALNMYRLNDGRVVLVSASKHYSAKRYYWYGITPSQMNRIGAHGGTHVVFALGTKAQVVIPEGVLRQHLPLCNTSLRKDGTTLRHYHIVISDEAEPELLFLKDGSRLALTEYLVNENVA